MCLRVMERRAKLLGLDAPQKIAPTNPSGENEFHSMSDEELLEIARGVVQGADV